MSRPQNRTYALANVRKPGYGVTSQRERDAEYKTGRAGRTSRIHALNLEVTKLKELLKVALEERRALEDEQFLEDHPCACVALNSQLGIFDMGEQERRGRVSFDSRSLVGESFTASRSCMTCGGTGKPR